MSHSSGYAVFHDPGGTTRRRNAAPFIPGTWIHLCSHFPWFSFRIYGVEANLFPPSHCISFETSRERERERARRQLKNTRKNFPSNRIYQSSRQFDERSEKFWKHVPLSLERETETLRKSRIEINHSGEESEIKIKSRRRSGDISFLETIFRTLHHPFLIGHAPKFYSPFIPLISRPVS